MKNLKESSFAIPIVALMMLSSFAAYASIYEHKRDPIGLFPIGQGGKWGYMDRTGKIVIRLQFDAASYFSEGLAGVMVDKKEMGILTFGKEGYIDSKGEWVIKPQFDYAGEFSEGLAVVRVGDKQGYINKSGALVIKPKFYSADNFS